MSSMNSCVKVTGFAVLTLLAAALACGPFGTGSPGGLSDTVTPYSPASTETTESPSAEATALSTAAAEETPSSGEAQPDLVITSVALSTNTPGAGGWVVVDVTIENQGGVAATGFELVLIPHYGWGPPNPAGYEELPNLPPGATHTTSFTPGVLYLDAGTFTLRVLVTDDWYELANPDSTGSGGDVWDEIITVVTPTVASGPDLVIASVALSTNTPGAGGWVVVDVTIENQGGAMATGFELVLIPHYGWGPPNPAGNEDLPSLAPGATYATTFTPGVLYPDAGTFTLRVLVTDDWYELANPDSTGSGGDIWDETIVVGGG